jgi:hypothetical protein
VQHQETPRPRNEQHQGDHEKSSSPHFLPLERAASTRPAQRSKTILLLYSVSGSGGVSAESCNSLTAV